MTSEAPSFWWKTPDWRAFMLSPLGYIYGKVACHRLNHGARVKIDAPVLCVGNFTVGGSGKTPVAISLVKGAIAQGLKPGFLSRGHSGTIRTPHVVDRVKDSARLVGDEPLLLARHAPTVVTPNRALAAQKLLELGCDFLIMDDGFQSARLTLDFSVLVVDARRGIGNGKVLPAGPLRAPIKDQMRYSDILVITQKGTGADKTIRIGTKAGLPIVNASAKAINPQQFNAQDFVAFAGIGEPEKFYDSLRGIGAHIVATRNFGDHHHYSDDDIDELLEVAQNHGAQLATTMKDAMRFYNGNEKAKAFFKQLQILDIEMAFDPLTAPNAIINATLKAFQKRRNGS